MLKLSKKSYNDFEIDEKFNLYLDFLEELFCHRCWYLSNKLKLENNIFYCDKKWHNFGHITKLMSTGKKINSNMFQEWKRNKTYGFLHGLILGFFLFEELSVDFNLLTKIILIYPKYEHIKEHDFFLEKLFYNCFFHDFDYLIENKNSNCFFPEVDILQNKKLFDMLNKILHNLDNKDFFNTINFKDNFKNSKLESIFTCFHVNYHRALEQIVLYIDDLWLSHKCEKNFFTLHQSYFQNKTWKHQSFYPEFYWIMKDKGMQECDDMMEYFCVYCGYLSSFTCLYHGQEIDANIRKHPTTFGMINKKVLTSLENEISYVPDSSYGRDHPCVKIKNKIPISNWIFLYRNPKIDLHTIDRDNNKIMSYDTFQKLIKVCFLIYEKIEAHKVL